MLIRPMMFRAPAGGGGILRPQDVFATSLWNGNSGNQAIVNGLDMAGKGGLAWLKGRQTSHHGLIDTFRGRSKILQSSTTAGEQTTGASNSLTAFSANGFSLGPDDNFNFNSSGSSYVGWSFLLAPKFFDIVTYTGDGTSGRQIPHNLGIAPGMVVIKRRNANGNWAASHRSLISSARGLTLNTTNGQDVTGSFNSPHTDTYFSVEGESNVNQSGALYVAYLFAHDPDPNGIIQCGKFTANGSYPYFAMPWRTQFLMGKCITTAGPWFMLDATRGWGSGNAADDAVLYANTSGAEQMLNVGTVYDDGIEFNQSSSFLNAGADYAWLAIRAPI